VTIAILARFVTPGVRTGFISDAGTRAVCDTGQQLCRCTLSDRFSRHSCRQWQRVAVVDKFGSRSGRGLMSRADCDQ